MLEGSLAQEVQPWISLHVFYSEVTAQREIVLVGTRRDVEDMFAIPRLAAARTGRPLGLLRKQFGRIPRRKTLPCVQACLQRRLDFFLQVLHHLPEVLDGRRKDKLRPNLLICSSRTSPSWTR